MRNSRRHMPFAFGAQRTKRGVVLVIVLSLIILLTILVIGFLSRAILDKQISTSSSSLTKTDLFAQGALKIVLGDIQNEIVAGSNTPVTPSNYNNTGTGALPLPSNTYEGQTLVYVPNCPGTVIPSLSLPGSLINTTTSLPVANAVNLLKISQTGIPFFSGSYAGFPVASNRASNIGTSIPSLNGRSIPLSTWNKPLLLPKNSNSITDLTPANDALVDPDWILVARDGSTPANPTFSATSSTSANNPVQSNSSFVVGRYAYVIYDEGGLLDANAAGAPAPVANAPSSMISDGITRLTTQAFNHKGSEAFADLSQLTSATLSADSTSPLLSNATINNLVGWRNYASAQATGSFPALAFADWTSYYSNILFNTSGFATGNPRGLTTGFLTPISSFVTGSPYRNNQTDRLFTSRQQLIAFLTASAANDQNSTSVSNAQSALQYLTHFSRDLEQPLIIPNPARPRIIDNGMSSTNDFVNDAAGGNSEYGNDRDENGKNKDDPSDVTLNHYVNPDFLNIPSNIQTGDMTPAIIQRFPLSRLALFKPYPNSPTGDTHSLFYQYFGLSRANSSTPWTYDHGGAKNGAVILTLREVAMQSPSRQPDFFEMLKAAIAVGSLGKGSGSSNSNTTNPSLFEVVAQQEMQFDTNVDYQILQIGANLIDQYKADNYPTRISPGYQPAVPVTISGVEDLPYFYRVRHRPIQTKSPLYSASNPIDNGDLLLIPEVWNPNMANPNDQGIPGPTHFRIDAKTGLGEYSGANTVYDNAPECFSQYGLLKWGEDQPGLPYSDPYSDYKPTCAILFDAPLSSGKPSLYYRQPTPLGVVGSTSSTSNLQFDTDNAPMTQIPSDAGDPTSSPPAPPFQINGGPGDPANGTAFVGFPCGSVRYQQVAQPANPTAVPPTLAVPPEPNYCNADAGFQIMVQYQDPQDSTKWFTYDSGNVSCNEVTDGATKQLPYPDDGAWTHLYGYTTRFDPRTSRWVMPEGAKGANITQLSSGIFATQSPTLSITTPVLDQNTPRALGFNAGSAQPGASQINTSPPVSSAVPYYTDPDGVMRSAMASYSTSVNTALPMSTNGYTSIGTGTTPNNRPMLLHRPFRSVAEMAYAFSGTPWKNIDFTNPQSGFSALLEAFCLNENDRADGMVAGRVNLNTRQVPVLKALLSGAYVDEFGSISPLTSTTAYSVAKALINRTQNASFDSGQGPLESRADLVGRYVPTGSTYSGLSADLSTALPTTGTPNQQQIPRWREASLRGLADVGTARTWNLLIDVIAQTGHYTSAATSGANFLVEGEKRYWLHVAIDRFTGKIIDQQLEPVSE
jgi:hypothetical protein